MSSQSPSLLPLNLHFTKLSRGVAALLITGFIVQLVSPGSRQFLALVPGRFIPCVWNVFTAGFLEASIFQLLFSVGSILLLARIIEPIWGSKEFLKFIAVTNLGTGVFALAVMYVWYIITSYRERAGKVLYMEVCGFHGIVAGCLVAVKQLLPDTEVTLVRIVKFHAKHLPSLFLLLAIALSVSLGTAMNTIPVVVASTYIAWFYLRFLQGKPGLNLRGDPSNEFRFATFFPEVLHPLVDRIAGSLGQLLRLTPSEEAGSTSAFVMQASPLPGSDSTESARRRERGARVLEERMTSAVPMASSAQETSVPDIEAPAASQESPNNGAKE